MIEGLKPISGQHSIKNAEAQIFIPQLFVKPEDDFKNFEDDSLFVDYQKKGTIQPTKISFNNKGGLGIEHPPIVGFIFESYNNGTLKDVFKVENYPETNRSIVSITTKKYTRWNVYKEEQLVKLFKALVELKPYVNAIGFTYLDEFMWEKENQIPVKKIFNADSELLNEKFLDSDNGTLVLISQGETIEGSKTEEKTELVFNNDLKRVQILHQFLVKLESPEKITTLEETKKLDNYFDIAHQEHKNFLKDLLTEDCKKLIGFIN